MNNPELVGFTCPNCHKVILRTLPSAKVYCGACKQWALEAKINLSPGTTYRTMETTTLKKNSKVMEKKSGARLKYALSSD